MSTQAERDAAIARAIEVAIDMWRQWYHLPVNEAEIDAADVLALDVDTLRLYRRQPPLTPVRVRKDIASMLERVGERYEATGDAPSIGALESGRALRVYVDASYAAHIAEAILLCAGMSEPARRTRTLALMNDRIDASPPPTEAPIRPDLLSAVTDIAREVLDAHNAKLDQDADKRLEAQRDTTDPPTP